MIYVVFIVIAATVISAIVSLFTEMVLLEVLGLMGIAVAALVVIDALVATAARMLPAKCANHEKKIFTVSAKEKKFYEKLKIRKWKDYIPEIGHFTGFRKNKIVDPKSVEYLDRFLLEICYGELGHFYSLFTGFAILGLFFVTPFWLAISVPVAVVNIFFNLPSLFILRYNSYKLVILRKSNLRKQAKA